VLLAATRDAARVCRRADLLGTLEAGKAADVLVVRRNPLADLTALSEVRLVVRAGAVIRQEPAAAP
jgi:imidazolonepropionase-like amidohydrolase